MLEHPPIGHRPVKISAREPRRCAQADSPVTLRAMIDFLKAAEHLPRLPRQEIDPLYKRLRWQIFAGIFFGYAGFYLVRLNFNLAMPYLVEQGYSRGALGTALSGLSLAYGVSKFLMGSVSDRSNPRFFLATGLFLSAGISLLLGLAPWATSSITIM